MMVTEVKYWILGFVIHLKQAEVLKYFCMVKIANYPISKENYRFNDFTNVLLSSERSM